MLLTKVNPSLLDEKRKFLSENIYGEIPAKPVHLSCDVGEKDEFFAAGKAVLKRHTIICELDGERKISFPITAIIPKEKTNIPAIISAEQNGDLPNKFLPIEEIIDRGYAVFCFNHADICDNTVDFKSKIYKSLASRRKKTAPGKIAMWAYAMIRIAEYVYDLDYIDKSRIIFSGHSYLGKSALLAGAFCDKAKFIIANDSYGFGSLSPHDSLPVTMPQMFCPNFAEENSVEHAKSEHYSLLLACSDKQVLVGAATDDVRSFPKFESECLNQVKLLNPDFNYHFHTREGSQYFSRQDWNTYLDYIDSFNII